MSRSRSGSGSTSSPLREPLLDKERPVVPAAGAGLGARRKLLALKKYAVVYEARVPIHAVVPSPQPAPAAAAAASAGLLSVLRVDGAAVGVIHAGDRITHVDGIRVSTWEAAVAAAVARCGGSIPIPATDDEETSTADDDAASTVVVELRLLRQHHPHLEEVIVDPPPPSSSTLSALAMMAAPASPPAADSVLGLLLAGGGCLLGAAASAASRSRSRASSWDYQEASTGADAAAHWLEQHAAEEEEVVVAAAQQALPPLPPYACWAHELGAAAALDGRTQRLPLAAFPFLWYEIATPDEARAGLPSLARRFGLSVDALRRDNRRHFPVGEPARLRPGLLLRLRNAEYDAKAAHAYAAPASSSSSAYFPPAAACEEAAEVAACLACGTGTDSEGQSFNARRRLRRLRGFHSLGAGAECSMAWLTRTYAGMSEAELRARNRHYFPMGVPSNEVLREGMLLKVELVLGEGEEPPAGFHSYHVEDAEASAPASAVHRPSSRCGCHAQASKGEQRLRRASFGTASLTSSSGSNSNSSSSIYSSGGQRQQLFPLVDVGGASGGQLEQHRHHGFV